MSDPRPTYPQERLDIIRLASSDAKPYLPQFWEISLGLRPLQDQGEAGIAPDGITSWMCYHNYPLVGMPPTVYGTRLLVDQNTSDLLGYGSVVEDDRGCVAQMRDEFGLDLKGALGGVHIFDPNKSLGLGTFLCAAIDADMSEGNWATFIASDNPWAVNICKRLGYSLLKSNHSIKGFGSCCDLYLKVGKVESAHAKPGI